MIDDIKAQRAIYKLEKFKTQQIENILNEVKKFEDEAKRNNLNITTITPEQIEKKLDQINSPMITSQGWSATSSPGTLNYNIGIYNPDPINHIWLFVHVFVGLANIAPDINNAVCAIDRRFPTATLPKFSGLSIAPGSSSSLNFSIPIPTGIPNSNYMGNSFLFQATWHDVGDYLDRSLFVFEIK